MLWSWISSGFSLFSGCGMFDPGMSWTWEEWGWGSPGTIFSEKLWLLHLWSVQRWDLEQPGVGKGVSAHGGGWNEMIFQILSYPKHSVIPRLSFFFFPFAFPPVFRVGCKGCFDGEEFIFFSAVLLFCRVSADMNWVKHFTNPSRSPSNLLYNNSKTIEEIAECVCGGQLSGEQNENCLNWPCHRTRRFCTFSFTHFGDVTFAKHLSVISPKDKVHRVLQVKSCSWLKILLFSTRSQRGYDVFFCPSLLKKGFRINQIFYFSPAIKNFDGDVVLCSKGWSWRFLWWL